MGLRHLTSINDLTNGEIEQVLELASRYLDELADKDRPWRVARGTDKARGRVLATLFYEPSTRTRLSFESAMLRLGGQVISVADMATSSSIKGESLADAVRIVESYADAIVIRHKLEGAPRLAADYARVPIINGGDGRHEHPTQTLTDLLTLRREKKKIKGMNVAVMGDLQNGRTVHSLAFALARFGANILTMPAKGLGLPKYVDKRLRHEFGCAMVPGKEYDAGNPLLESVYVQSGGARPSPGVDVIYVTRFQKERAADPNAAYPTIGPDFLRDKRYENTLVLHPLPRVDELDVALDNDPRAGYFRQASYGVAVRMALMALLLGIDGKLESFDGGFRQAARPTSGLRCGNSSCIVHAERGAQNKFVPVAPGSPKLRCLYCESEAHG